MICTWGPTCGRACGPGDTLCRKHGGNPLACGICGALACPGHVDRWSRWRRLRAWLPSLWDTSLLWWAALLVVAGLAWCQGGPGGGR